MLVLSNRHSYVWHGDMKSWIRVADDSYPTSVHSTLLPSRNASTLQQLQSFAAAAPSGSGQRRAPQAVFDAALHQPAHVQFKQNRAHLESNIGAALVMQNPSEWRRWMVMYVRYLAAEGDQVMNLNLKSNLKLTLNYFTLGR